MKTYCEKCGLNVDAKIVVKTKTHLINKQKITCRGEVIVCPFCQNECEDHTLSVAMDEYRRKNQLMFPSEIKQLRLQYGLSSSALSLLCNWDKKLVHRYEEGLLIKKGHNALLLFLKDPENMRSYLINNKNKCSPRILSELQEIIKKTETIHWKNMKYLNSLFDLSPCLLNGYRYFDYLKIASMVLYFVNKYGKEDYVRLMILLFYSDMFFYKRYDRSMTGGIYLYSKQGVVLRYGLTIFGIMESEGLILVKVDDRVIIYTKGESQTEGLSNKEIKILEQVYEKFKFMDTHNIVHFINKEKYLSECYEGQEISYEWVTYEKKEPEGS